MSEAEMRKRACLVNARQRGCPGVGVQHTHTHIYIYIYIYIYIIYIHIHTHTHDMILHYIMLYYRRDRPRVWLPTPGCISQPLTLSEKIPDTCLYRSVIPQKESERPGTGSHFSQHIHDSFRGDHWLHVHTMQLDRHGTVLPLPTE